jgi:hypothetical protein
MMWDMSAFLRHTLSTLAYRAGKTLRDAPPEFANFSAGPGMRTPVEILAHMGDLLDWGAGLADGRDDWRDSTPLAWNREVERFFRALDWFDGRFATGEPSGFAPERIFSGPIADALTHTGQIAMLRRMAGAPVRGENYFRAEIIVGRVGADQAPPVREFD